MSFIIFLNFNYSLFSYFLFEASLYDFVCLTMDHLNLRSSYSSQLLIAILIHYSGLASCWVEYGNHFRKSHCHDQLTLVKVVQSWLLYVVLLSDRTHFGLQINKPCDFLRCALNSYQPFYMRGSSLEAGVGGQSRKMRMESFKTFCIHELLLSCKDLLYSILDLMKSTSSYGPSGFDKIVRQHKN